MGPELSGRHEPCRLCTCEHPKLACVCDGAAKHQYEVEPKIGIGVTMYVGSDRYPGTIVRISRTGRRIWVRSDRAVRSDGRGPRTEHQEHTFRENEHGTVVSYSKRRNGRWMCVGTPTQGTQSLSIGFRDAYQDPRF